MATTATSLSDDTNEKPPRRRHWIPLSLKAFVAILGILGAVTAWKVARVYRQGSALREIESIGGSVMILTDPSPEWLEDLIGWERTFELLEPTEIELTGPQVTDQTLKHLVRLPKLETVTLKDTMVTDAGVGELRRALPGLMIVR